MNNIGHVPLKKNFFKDEETMFGANRVVFPEQKCVSWMENQVTKINKAG